MAATATAELTPKAQQYPVMSSSDEAAFQGIIASDFPNGLVTDAADYRTSAIHEPGEPNTEYAHLTEGLGHAAVIEVARLANIEANAREKAARLFGRIAMENAGASKREAQSQEPEMSLLEALRCGNRELVEMNVGKDLVERGIKVGGVTTVEMQVNERGEVIQFGQTDEEVQKNSLIWVSHDPRIHGRHKANTRTVYRTREVRERGLLKENALVVFSLVDDEMSLDELENAHFYTDTMSLSIQLTTEKVDGTLVLESAFVAGKRTSDSGRHDPEVLARLGEQRLKIDFRGKTTTQILDMPVLIPKKYIKNGVIDIVKWWDEIQKELTSQDTFYGQDNEPQDYVQHKQDFQAWEAGLAPIVQTITDQLIAESDSFITPLDATGRLDELSAKHLLHRAVEDERIDPIVFGAPAAFYIEGARHHLKRGETDQAAELEQKALSVETSSSCPTSTPTKSKTGDGEESGSDNGDCEYISKKCPKCGKKNVKTWDKSKGGNKRRISGACGHYVDYVVATKQSVSLAS